MQRRKWFRTAAFALLAASFLASGSGILAKTVVKTDVTNNFQVGIVDIELDEYSKDASGKESVYVNELDILPAQTVSKIPRVKNEAVDSYVRLKIDISTNFETDHPITLENISGWNEHLKKVGDYYYYTKILKNGEKFDVFNSVTFPSEWDNTEDGKVEIKITADAIQARNFVPKFDTKNPWGNVEIEHCLHEDGYDFNKLKKAEDNNLSVTLIDKAEGLVHKPDDFFLNFPYLLPGDTITDSVELKNSYSQPMNLYFASSTMENGGTLDELLVKIVCKLSDGTSRTTYEGKLNTDMEYKLLGTFGPGAEGELIFTVSVPAELKNKYSLDTGKVKWLFMAEFDEPEPEKPEKPKPPTPEKPKPSTPTPKPTPPTTKPVPDTDIRKSGDEGMMPYIIVFLLSAAGIAYMAYDKKKGEAR